MTPFEFWYMDLIAENRYVWTFLNHSPAHTSFLGPESKPAFRSINIFSYVLWLSMIISKENVWSRVCLPRINDMFFLKGFLQLISSVLCSVQVSLFQYYCVYFIHNRRQTYKAIIFIFSLGSFFMYSYNNIVLSIMVYFVLILNLL